MTREEQLYRVLTCSTPEERLRASIRAMNEAYKGQSLQEYMHLVGMELEWLNQDVPVPISPDPNGAGS